MGDASASYIRMVQHLIEKCLVFRMNREESVEALSKYAGIKPVITSTVWKELEKENREFFEAYERQMEDRPSREEPPHKIQAVLSDFASKASDD
ncbi:unnamed protein product [Spirodela intermedia]|uniref:Uncharacterized protein n=2 Tax=Spirodela intermedia TaxID=51605 RepID=A0A7I8JGU3_SPIIN|nr:unnamed protein product [Spirodela intermedia]CAA6669360.1 unnamed protein product [Spirodela intermedia]CAA7406309.1 unnamed protein product [Spirodela intermedia]